MQNIPQRDRGEWEHQSIIPEDYVEESWMQHSIAYSGEGYGYLWFLPQWSGHATHCAVGYGGQAIAVVPDADLVVAITSSSEPGSIQPRIIMNDFVLPAIE